MRKSGDMIRDQVRIISIISMENLQKRSKTCKCARKPKKSSNMEEIEDVVDESRMLRWKVFCTRKVFCLNRVRN
jgi:hypothetical protein